MKDERFQQWFTTFLPPHVLPPPCPFLGLMTLCPISDVYELLTVPGKRDFPFKRLTWFHLNETGLFEAQSGFMFTT